MNKIQHQMKVDEQLYRLRKYETNHILHFLLTVVTLAAFPITFGVWLAVWPLVTLSNFNERQKCRKRLDKLARVEVTE